MNLHEIIIINEKGLPSHWNANCNVPSDDFISACPLKQANK